MKPPTVCAVQSVLDAPHSVCCNSAKPRRFRMKRYIARIIFLMTLCFGLPLYSQQGASAGLYGTVSDSQGAIIPGASVRLIQLSTNQARNAVSNDLGQFRFPLIPVGTYQVTAEKPGFKKFEQTGIQLQ